MYPHFHVQHGNITLSLLVKLLYKHRPVNLGHCSKHHRDKRLLYMHTRLLKSCYVWPQQWQWCCPGRTSIVTLCLTKAFMMVQEVDRVVARVRARENEQHDALSPVQSFVNAHMQVLLNCLCLHSALLAALLPIQHACSMFVSNAAMCTALCTALCKL